MKQSRNGVGEEKAKNEGEGGSKGARGKQRQGEVTAQLEKKYSLTWEKVPDLKVKSARFNGKK